VLREGELLPLAQREEEGEPEGERLPHAVVVSLRLAAGDNEGGALREAPPEPVGDTEAQRDVEGEGVGEPDCEALALAHALPLPLPLREGEGVAEAEADTRMVGAVETVTEALPLTLRVGGASVGEPVAQAEGVVDWDAEAVAEPPLPHPEGDTEGDAEPRTLRDVEGEPDTLRVGGGEREAEDEVEGQCDAEAQGEVEGVRVAQEVTLAVTEGEDVAEGVLPRLPLPLGEGDTVTEGRRPVPDTEGEEEGLRVTPPADAVGGAGEPDDEPLTEAQRDVVGDAVGEVDAEAQPLLLTVLRTVRDTEGEPVPHAVTLGV
jgi:hypothetical protein